ncbi:MAG: Ala-tRNA(Pro) hydrolase [Anaerolineae bacterium SM23_ 63]|nr:MAG: Ala-tRNA(Pro) hydrolase [Anaerolineae bacterium SM23_ 63]HEY48238.1 alanyl-tRNA editing protein [Anaerolineae bacterium]
MTELLYQHDAYIKAFDAVVTDVGEDAVALNSTAFFPAGGGQPCDHGTLLSADSTWSILNVRKLGGDVWHHLAGDLPTVGNQVKGEIDWERRYQLMRTHTAMHILCGVIWRDYSASVTGGQMQPLRGRMDFEFETMRKELVQEIEEKINVEVQASRVVKVHFLPREEAFKIPDLIRTKINLLPPSIEVVRVVEIEGLDLQADGGTHVANTEEVGEIRIVDYKSKGAINKRLVVELDA